MTESRTLETPAVIIGGGLVGCATAYYLAKEHGITLEKAILSLCYKEKTQDSVKASIWKSFLESMVTKESKQSIDLSGYLQSSSEKNSEIGSISHWI